GPRAADARTDVGAPLTGTSRPIVAGRGLERVISVDYKERRLEEVLAGIGALAGIESQGRWATGTDAGLDPEQIVSLRVENARRWIGAPGGCGWAAAPSDQGRSDDGPHHAHHRDNRTGPVDPSRRRGRGHPRERRADRGDGAGVCAQADRGGAIAATSRK